MRRAALLNATIDEIGLAGSLDVTVGQIAKRAGMSTALAHYYYNSKNEIFVAAMRHILWKFGQSVGAQIKSAKTMDEKLFAIVDASLGREQFERETVAAWLVFYVEAQHSPDAARLLRVYARRLHSNLVHCLCAFVPKEDAHEIAEGVAAMIDGFYIRHGLSNGRFERPETRRMVKDYVEMSLEKRGVSLITRSQ